MSNSEGFDKLNLPQLLDLMHDVVRPEPVNWLPQTAGWWILAAWLLVAGLLVARDAHCRWRGNRYRRHAQRELKAIEVHAGPDAAIRIAMLLKRTALAAYPRDKVAHLYGTDWARFLRESADEDPLIAAWADEMAAAAYRKHIDAAGLVEPARRWIELHRD